MECFGITDRGRVRPTNQDIYRIETNAENRSALIIVCDGMGGANAGNVASRFAADAFAAAVSPSLGGALCAEERQALLERALVRANDTVFELAGRQPEFRGMGTTLVAALVKDGEATVLNVGDSRAYLLDGDALHQLTEDHSYVNEMRMQGRITEEAARNHPQKNLITRAVGVDPTVEGDLYEVALAESEVLLLCSDGLSGMVEDSVVAAALRESPSLENAANALLTLAMAGGGKDNITAALFCRGGAPAEKEA